MQPGQCVYRWFGVICHGSSVRCSADGSAEVSRVAVVTGPKSACGSGSLSDSGVWRSDHSGKWSIPSSSTSYAGRKFDTSPLSPDMKSVDGSLSVAADRFSPFSKPVGRGLVAGCWRPAMSGDSASLECADRHQTLGDDKKRQRYKVAGGRTPTTQGALWGFNFDATRDDGRDC